MRVRLASALLLILFLAGWEVYCRAAGVSALVVPLPSAVLRTLWDGLAGGYLLPHLWVTTAEMAMGLAAGCTVGFLAGVLLAEVPVLRRLFYPYILASQVVPKLALGPLFIVWFGFGMTSTVVITALICFFPLLENTMTGLQQVDPNKRELFRMLRATRLQTLLRLKIPSGLPVILAGLRVAVVLALVGAVVGEFIGGRQGLGASIIAAQGMMDSTMMFALFIVITVLGMIVYQAAAGLERWLLRRPWKG
ncbi:ABC transporter permease (plasmid) [Azospirillum sp. TSH58]|uniref:ABC transporter permease n=1 Tax=Azospirillum sp. TSH58 TaxID=664962 RepID=UPI000D6006AE|nr:ABC transporter permease [Azospirillum sp. TSH58]AWJ86847.1 ABC transporter permease [Azospirillum sp. TSH58]PWC72150.1 ABC transporter permease [Azospirillum sp. TSH58]